MQTPNTIRYPKPLQSGDLIGITAPSAGISAALEPRLQYGLSTLRALGFATREGRCLRASGFVSAPAKERAAELQRMLLDPDIALVLPPWGGEISSDILPHLDFEALRAGPPKWLVGYSDTSCTMLPYTLLTGISTAHGGSLMEADMSFDVDGIVPWHTVVGLAEGASFDQHMTALYEPNWNVEWRHYEINPSVDHFNLTEKTQWKVLGRESDSAAQVAARGRLIGGCLDVVSPLAGSRYGDVPAFAERYAPEGLLVYLENCDATHPDACRRLRGLRLAGWFDRANAILIGRSTGPVNPNFSFREVLLSAFDGLEIPVVYDMDIGHMQPQLTILNGALGELRAGTSANTLRQTLA